MSNVFNGAQALIKNGLRPQCQIGAYLHTLCTGICLQEKNNYSSPKNSVTGETNCLIHQEIWKDRPQQFKNGCNQTTNTFEAAVGSMELT